jgi:hypothetical protein
MEDRRESSDEKSFRNVANRRGGCRLSAVFEAKKEIPDKIFRMLKVACPAKARMLNDLTATHCSDTEPQRAETERSPKQRSDGDAHVSAA